MNVGEGAGARGWHSTGVLSSSRRPKCHPKPEVKPNIKRAKSGLGMGLFPPHLGLLQHSTVRQLTSSITQAAQKGSETALRRLANRARRLAPT